MSFRESRRLETAIASLRLESESRDLSDVNKARLAQLLAVWASGYLEASCRDILLAYTSNRADPSVVRYVQRKLERFPNPRIQNIVSEISNFDENAADEIESFADGRIKESVNSIVAIRNQVAHGRSSTTSMARVGAYAHDAKKLVNRIRAVLRGRETGRGVAGGEIR